ncbi:hypothetical protein QFC22_000578 [Naganishia vaughanmartiniae]|uniref:Uncharacterized protein n=1 Tax=Naganishia vaughanmartiniae TaxID=1424756 RepID=A0ACC2XPQ1_9TREE|nr:hypothetical protein QFC22_000578 [Naganishia vaughanmartiniae]
MAVPMQAINTRNNTTAHIAGSITIRATTISTGTGVAPFLQLVCKIANLLSPIDENSNPSAAQPLLPKLSLIQYLPRSNHTVASADTSPVPSARTATDSLPAEEFSDLESSLDAGPDIIRHPDVLSPVLRKRLADAGVLRLLRVRAGEAIDSSVLANSLQTGGQAATTVDIRGKGNQEQDSSGTGSWFSWLTPSSNKSPPDSSTPPPAQEVTLRDGKLGDQRVGVMTCLPLQ